jgi:hypothetical protein
VRASNLAKRRSRSSLVSDATPPFLPAVVRVVDLTADSVVRFTLLPELPFLPLTLFDSFFITTSGYSTPKVEPKSEIEMCVIGVPTVFLTLVYGIDAQTIIAIAVAHTHRKPRYWIDRVAA